MSSEIKSTTVQTNSLKDKTGTRTLASDSGSAWSWGAGVPADTIIQVKQTIKTDKEDITGTTGTNNHAFIPAQGGSGVFQESITTTDSNKVLIDVRLNVSVSNGYAGTWAIFRGSATDTAIGSCTKIAVGTEASTNQSSATCAIQPGSNSNSPLASSMLFLDSPSTGTHFYKIGWQAENGSSGYINRGANNATNYYNGSFISSITLYEVKA